MYMLNFNNPVYNVTVAEHLAQKAQEVLNDKASTAHMAGNGNMACAESVNKLIINPTVNASNRVKLSTNDAHIGTLLKDLNQKGLFEKVAYNNRGDIRLGDLVVTGNPDGFGNAGHIGVATYNGKIASNNSDKKAFVNDQMKEYPGKTISMLYRSTERVV